MLLSRLCSRMWDVGWPHAWRAGEAAQFIPATQPYAAPVENLDIPVPQGDLFYDPTLSGTEVCYFRRSYPFEGNTAPNVRGISNYCQPSRVLVRFNFPGW